MTDWEILNAGIEHAEHAIAVYQFEGKRKRVVCVSDGMFSIMRGADEADKPAFLRRLESDRYRNVPAEDARILAEEVRRFASGGSFDIVYREMLVRNSGSTLIHAVGHHHVLDDGERVLIVEYSDLTAAAWTQVQPRKSFEQSLQSFLDQSDLALLAVTKDRGELRYCNARM